MSDQMAAAGRLGRRTRDWGLTRAPCAAAAAMQADADSARSGVILGGLNLNALAPAPASEAS